MIPAHPSADLESFLWMTASPAATRAGMKEIGKNQYDQKSKIISGRKKISSKLSSVLKFHYYISVVFTFPQLPWTSTRGKREKMKFLFSVFIYASALSLQTYAQTSDLRLLASMIEDETFEQTSIFETEKSLEKLYRLVFENVNTSQDELSAEQKIRIATKSAEKICDVLPYFSIADVALKTFIKMSQSYLVFSSSYNKTQRALVQSALIDHQIELSERSSRVDHEVAEELFKDILSKDIAFETPQLIHTKIKFFRFLTRHLNFKTFHGLANFYLKDVKKGELALSVLSEFTYFAYNRLKDISQSNPTSLNSKKSLKRLQRFFAQGAGFLAQATDSGKEIFGSGDFKSIERLPAYFELTFIMVYGDQFLASSASEQKILKVVNTIGKDLPALMQMVMLDMNKKVARTIWKIDLTNSDLKGPKSSLFAQQIQSVIWSNTGDKMRCIVDFNE